MLRRARLVLGLLSLSCLLAGNVRAEGPAAPEERGDTREWVTVEATVSLSGFTPREAMQAALRRARFMGVVASCGISVDDLSWTRDPESLMRFIGLVGGSQLQGERIEEWEAIVDQDDPRHPPSYGVGLSLSISVACDEWVPAPSAYGVGVELDEPSVRSGEELSLTVSPTHDSFITVIGFAPNDSVHLFYPNSVQSGRVVRGGEKVVVPTPMGRRTGLVRLEVRTTPGEERSWGLLWVVATRDRMELAAIPELGEGLAYLGAPPQAAALIAERLISLPLSARAMNVLHYEVVAGE